MKIVIVAFLVLVLVALGGAGFFMLRHEPGDGGTEKSADKSPDTAPDTSLGRSGDRSPDMRMARALTIRVGLSVTLFLLILLAYALGWIHPTGIPVGT